MPRSIFSFLALGLGLAMTCEVQASLITNAGGVLPTSTVVDFSQFGPYSFTGGPIQIGALVGEDITWESTNSSSVIGSGGYGLGGNGSWTGAKTYTGVNTDLGSMTYRFHDGAVAQVGGFVNYTIAPDGPSDMFIEALGVGDVVLESYNITSLAPISTPFATNDGAFRGIARGTADILAFRVSNKFVVLDDLTFGRSSMTAVPEPATLQLIGMGLIAAVGYGWRRRKAG